MGKLLEQITNEKDMVFDFCNDIIWWWRQRGVEARKDVSSPELAW
jgi:hypothetical protein